MKERSQGLSCTLRPLYHLGVAVPARSVRKIFLSLMTALLVLVAVPLHAHESTLGGSKWCFGKNRILAAIELGASLYPEIRGISEGGYDLEATPDDQLKRMTADVIQPYISERLSVSVNDKTYPVKVNKVVLEGSLWRIWLSVDGIAFNRPENRVKIDYRLLFEETKNVHVNIAYMYLADASLDEVQKVFDYSHPVAHNAFDSNSRSWELSVKGAADEPAAAPKAATPAAGTGSPSLATTGPAQKDSPVSTMADRKASIPLLSLNPAADVPEAAQVRQVSDNSPAMVSSYSEDRANGLVLNNPAKKSSWAGMGEFIVLGIKHILIGYDHIAFLLALIVIGLSVREVLKIITAFTIAHSITLLLAALQIVSLNSRLVEIVIALSICYVALENLFRKKVNYRWLVTFGFGLIHGFGFASVLQDFIVGQSDLVLSVLSFNVGVELGQLLIFLVLLPILHLLKNRLEFRKITVGASAAIFVLGLAWLVERVFNLKLLSL
ncbi:MAG: HupE/UreJ family protein [Geobacteraceae bacterium]|nr:HupE/UreJ family protein [Geobacteraceae bacterium]